MTGHTPDYIMTATVGTSKSLNYRCSQGRCLIGQDHTTNPTAAEAPVTIGGVYPVPHPITTAACTTHWPTDALGNTLTGTNCTSATTTHPRHAIFLTRVTLKAIPQTEADQVPDSLTILPLQTNTQKVSKLHPKTATPHKSHHQKKVTIQDSQSDSSSESDNDSDPLNY